MKPKIVYFPQDYVRLCKELGQPDHALLRITLQEITSRYTGKNNLPGHLQAIANYCGMDIAGYFTEADLLATMALLTEELRKKRTIYISTAQP